MSEQEITVSIRNAEGQELEQVKFSGASLEVRHRPSLIKEAVVMYLANKRQGTHDTKTRSELAFTNKKPWRQKGTGRARAGTRRSPLWVGGGIIFGPHPRDYSYQINKKQRRLALRSALFGKFRDGEVQIIDRLEIPEPKTRHVAKVLKALNIGGKCLIGVEAYNRNLALAARNIEGVQLLPVADFNALEVLKAKTILLTKAALEKLTAAGSSGSVE
ncbi:MAG: 50S ribosomal protein L4 [Planctomycetes bacterium]|nr:50S ribosomal protein L4 [Planctomycetota bacterium]